MDVSETSSDVEHEEAAKQPVSARHVELATSIYVIAALIIIVAGMRMAAPILVPFLVSLFIAIVCDPFVCGLERRGLARWAALTLVICGAIVIGLSIVAMIGESVTQFSEQVPVFQERLAIVKQEFLDWLQMNGIGINRGVNHEGFDAARIFGFANSIVSGMGGMFGDVFLILLTVILLLVEFPTLPAKFSTLPGDNQARVLRANRISREVRHYLAIKIWTSFITGGLVALLMFVLEVDFALMWGLLAFLLNFVPNIGSIIAAIPAVLLALVQLGIWPAVYASLGYLAINSIVGNILEPRWMGRGLGLSTLVVFISMVFWGWVLGPIGMVFSVPLTMIAKIYLECDERTRWMAVMLGNE